MIVQHESSAFEAPIILPTFQIKQICNIFYHSNIKLQVHTNYKLHEMKKEKLKQDSTGHKSY